MVLVHLLITFRYRMCRKVINKREVLFAFVSALLLTACLPQFQSSDAAEKDGKVFVRPETDPNLDRTINHYEHTVQESNYEIPLETDPSLQDCPSLLLVWRGGTAGYYLAYQSWETGLAYNGDIFVKEFNTDWEVVRKKQVTDLHSYQDRPSLVYDGAYLYVVYISNENGYFNIFVQKFDDSLNSVYKKQITNMNYTQDRPSALAVNGYFYVAYQSWETGDAYHGDIFVEKFNNEWNSVKKVRVTTETSYQDSPSLSYTPEGDFYVAYVSDETGDWDIFAKKYNSNLNYVGKFQLTTEASDQDRPSLNIKLTEASPGWDGFILAYQSWETGSTNIGDIFVKYFDTNFNEVDKVQVTNDQYYQDSPSITPEFVVPPHVFSAYVAYVSNKTGSWDIFASMVQEVQVEGVITISNGILEVAVRGSRDPLGISGMGTYTVRTGPGHSNPNQDVFFGGAAKDPWTTYNTIHVVDTAREYVSTSRERIPDSGYTCFQLDNMNPTVTFNSTMVTTSWQTPENLLAVQEIEVVGTTELDTKVRVTTKITNKDTVAHKVGVRYEWDVMVDAWDGSWIRTWASGTPSSWLNTEEEWTPPAYEYWETTNYPLNPLFYIFGSISSPAGSIPPDKTIFASWPSSNIHAYSYTPSSQVIGGTNASTGGEYDSAMLYYWNPKSLSPGGSTTATAYIFSVRAKPSPEDILITEVIRPETLRTDLNAFMLPSPLLPGMVITPAVHGSGNEYLIQNVTWFCWIDDCPYAMFEHPTRYVFIDDVTGNVTVAVERWWPSLNGKELWATPDEYWNRTYWVYSTYVGENSTSSTIVGGHSITQVESNKPPAHNALTQSKRRGLIIDGPDPYNSSWLASESWRELLIEHFHYSDDEIIYLSARNDRAYVDDDSTKGNIVEAIQNLSETLSTGDSLSIFIAMHAGNINGVPGNGQFALRRAETLQDKELAQLLSQIEEGVHITVVIDSCFSGSFIDDLCKIPQVEIIVTATDWKSMAHHASSGLDPPDGCYEFVVNMTADPNKEDEGGEFSSGLIEGLEKLAPAFNRGEIALGKLYIEAFKTAKELDAGYINRKFLEENVSDDAAPDPQLKIKIFEGDVDMDGVVNVVDLFITAKVFGSELGDIRWNFAADVNCDFMINVVDLFLIAKNYGKRYY